MNKQQAGFTLIELVMVIVILGILAATAIPKYLDLEGQAKTAVLQGAKGALQSSAVILYAKNKGATSSASIISETQTDNVTVTLTSGGGGTDCVFGLTYSGGTPTDTVTISKTLCN